MGFPSENFHLPRTLWRLKAERVFQLLIKKKEKVLVNGPWDRQLPGAKSQQPEEDATGQSKGNTGTFALLTGSECHFVGFNFLDYFPNTSYFLFPVCHASPVTLVNLLKFSTPYNRDDNTDLRASCSLNELTAAGWSQCWWLLGNREGTWTNVVNNVSFHQ